MGTAIQQGKNLIFKLSNGFTIPAVGFGTWSSEPGARATMGELVKHAISKGYRHIDCAPIYGNEVEIGKAIQESIKEGLVKRDELFITSKLWNDAHKREDVRPALEKSLKDLQLDYLDLYLVHWPVSNERKGDYPNRNTPPNFVPISETWSALEACVEAKLVRSIGISNFNIQLTRDLLSYAKIKPQVNQVELHPHLTQDVLVRFCKENGILVSAYALLGGQSVGKGSILDIEIIKEIANKHKKSTAQVLIRWAIQCGINPLPKSAKAERVEANFDIFDFSLSDEEVSAISKLNTNRRFNDPANWDPSVWPPVFG